MGWWTEKALHAKGTPRPLFLVGATALLVPVCVGLALANLPLLYPLTVLMGLCFGFSWTLLPSLASELFGLSYFARWALGGAGHQWQRGRVGTQWGGTFVVEMPCHNPWGADHPACSQLAGCAASIGMHGMPPGQRDSVAGCAWRRRWPPALHGPMGSKDKKMDAPLPPHPGCSNYAMLQLSPALGSIGLSMQLTSWFYQRALTRHGTSGQTCLGRDCFAPTFLVAAALGVGGTAAAAWLYMRTRPAYAQVHRAVLREDGALATVEPHHPEEEGNGYSSSDECISSPRKGHPVGVV